MSKARIKVDRLVIEADEVEIYTKQGRVKKLSELAEEEEEE